MIMRVDEPQIYLNEWGRMYDNLIDPHNITGVTKFSERTFEGMFETPGLHVYKSSLVGEIVGMVLFYEMDEVVYYHLGAYSDDGYLHNASFGLFLQAIEDFSTLSKKWLNLGSGAGQTENENDGLTRFKKGWASETRTAWFCGKILNKGIYNKLSWWANPNSNFFPLYRSGQDVKKSNIKLLSRKVSKDVKVLEGAV